MQDRQPRSAAEQEYAEAAEEFRKIVDQHGPQSPEAMDKAAEFRQRLEAYIQSISS
jgi:hypothetical protein